MTVDTHSGVIPQWTLADRLRKARELTGLDQLQFATEIGISRNTVGGYEKGRTKKQPPLIVLRAWSLRTGVPLQWLQTGMPPEPDGDGDGGVTVRHQGLEPRTRWLNRAAGQDHSFDRIVRHVA